MTQQAIIWIAVSSESQASEDKASLAEQEQKCRAWCEAQSLAVKRVLSVPGFSRSESDLITMMEELAAQGCFAYHDLRKHWQPRDFDVLVAYADDRLGRSSTAVSYVIENTIKMGARIYLLHGGWVDKSSHRFRIAMSGVNVSQQLDQFTERYQMGMNKRAEKGLPTGPKPLFTHTVVRDEYGRPLGRMIVRKERRRFLNDLAELLLDGLSWRKLGEGLYERGHVSDSGKMFFSGTLYDTLHNPVFWGNNARFYADRHNVRRGVWAFDKSQPPPPGVLMVYGSHEPAFTGQTAVDVQRELHRRAKVIRGSASGSKTHRFTGLLCCDECGRTLAYSEGKNPLGVAYPRYRCTSRWVEKPTAPSVQCTQRKSISVLKIQAKIDQIFRSVIGQKNAMELLLLNPEPAAPSLVEIKDGLKNEIEILEAQIAQMVYHQATAPEVARKIYTDQIEQASTRLHNLFNQMNEVQHRAALDYQRQENERTLETILADLGEFWQREDREVNQVLHALFAHHRFMVIDGEIVSLKRL
jgi:DNA invertase Pin-like site-specific DNA recombinase